MKFSFSKLRIRLHFFAFQITFYLHLIFIPLKSENYKDVCVEMYKTQTNKNVLSIFKHTWRWLITKLIIFHLHHNSQIQGSDKSRTQLK